MTIQITLTLKEAILVRDALREIPYACDPIGESVDKDTYCLNSSPYTEQEIDMLAMKFDDVSAPFIDVP